EDCSTDKSTVCKYLRLLRNAGLIHIRERTQGGVYTTSIITLLVEENPPLAKRKKNGGSGASPTTSGLGTTRVVGRSRHKPSYEPSDIFLPGDRLDSSKDTYTRTRNAYARARDGGEL